MPRGLKKSRFESKVTRTSGLASPSSKPSIPTRSNHDDGSNALEPIVISDDDDERDDDNVDEATIGVDQVEDPAPANESPDSSAPLQSLASRFTYESPAKSRPGRNAASTPFKLESIKRVADLEQRSSSSASFSVKSSAIEDHSSASTSTDSAPSRAPKKAKAVKTVKDLTIRPKKTIDQAKEAGIEPLDLSNVSAAGFKLISRCSFCAGSFTKSAAAKVKQEHMSLCAPLSGITQSTTAFDTVASDIRSSLKRDEETKRKVRDERTVFQEVVQDADIVLHEGRASQIEASPKKRGKDSIITKKAIKRSTKVPLLISEEHSPSDVFTAHTTSNKLISAQKAKLMARSVADQLFGRAASSTFAGFTSSSKSEEVEQGQVDADPRADHPDRVVPSTPKKAKARALTPVPGGGFELKDGQTDEANQLPVVSAEQVFASMSASASPQKSPIKALQKSRERQASRDNDVSFEFEGSDFGLGSPSLPRTQQFAPSKLAQRRRASNNKDVPSLFAAETTTRSLLDLVKTHSRSESREVSAELKRKSAEADEDEQSPDSKRCKMVSNANEAEPKIRSPIRESKKPSPEVLVNGDLREPPLAASESALGSESDMDVDAQTVEAVLSQPHEPSSSVSGKLQDQDRNIATSRSASPAQVTHKSDAQASPQSQQVPNVAECLLRASKNDDFNDEVAKGFDTDSILEDDDEDAQSFLELLEPLEAPLTMPSPTYSLSELSSEDPDEPDSRDSAYQTRRMSVATGGSSFTIESRRKAINSEFPRASQARPVVCNTTQESSESPISNSDPEAMLVTDHGSDSTPQP
ncbi:hypothetical protein NDA16_001923 [Ustilago loliicola]|nr:hypothetical protein NDA16_001923 [Ustilago loliicola]